MKYESFDLVIVGGGCSGLSLARELSNLSSWCKRTLIIETRASYTNDRSWCFWWPDNHNMQQLVEPMITSKWENWRFSGNNFTKIHTSRNKPYCYISADNFYQDALTAINRKANIQLRLGTTLMAAKKNLSRYLLELSDGSSILASQVIDTRPQSYNMADEAQLWQIFYGYEIETTVDFFDDSSVGLMENLTKRKNATEFIYLLPFSKKKALLEVTQFTNELFHPKTLATELDAYLAANFDVDNVTILRSEQGCLPMGLNSSLSTTSHNYHHYGISAGAIRPATGYAFLRIQQWANLCAAHLSQGKEGVPAIQSSKLIKAMDRVFLRVLHDEPSVGVDLFKAMAEHVSGAALVRFLMEEASARDYYDMIKALPKYRFLLYSLKLNKLLLSKQAET